MAKAVALFSGGLDSTLAILVMLRHGIDITAVTFLTHFGCDISDSSSCSKNPYPAAEKFGFSVKLCHLADKFIDITKNPKFGHGRNMNPCIDCRILMLREAKALMEMIGADFIITGEVLGQRPMSQRRDTLNIVDREAAVKGLVVRPLSGRLLAATEAEQRGLIRREMLLGFNGRSRKPQMALAKELGLTDYPAPASGCLLTEPNYSYRLRELLNHTPAPTLDDLSLLRLGRHFRFSATCKAIVGRDERENEAIEAIGERGGVLMRADGFGSPTVLVTGSDAASFLSLAASLCVRYSDARDLAEAAVAVSGGGSAPSFLTAQPASRETIEAYRIERPERKAIQPLR